MYAVEEVAVEDEKDRLDNADQLSRQFRRFLRLLDRTHAQITDHRVERAGYILLAQLVNEGPQRTTALAEAVRSDTSTVSRQISTLVRSGLVERTADPADGRACLLAATSEGRLLFDAMRMERTRYIDQVLQHWPLARRRQLVDLFDQLNTSFENHWPQITQPRKVSR
ncbi:MAG: MarR family transcriptional regulator [Kutzneria sp.]|nr:MarR family transcriptional regulator [Kutzneria sp.]